MEPLKEQCITCELSRDSLEKSQKTSERRKISKGGYISPFKMVHAKKNLW